MIQLHITKTGKGYNPKETFSCFDQNTKYFSDIKEAKQWLKEEYGKSKRSRMYVDTKEGAGVLMKTIIISLICSLVYVAVKALIHAMRLFDQLSGYNF